MSEKRESIDKLVKQCADSMHISVLNAEHDYSLYTRLTGMEPEDGKHVIELKEKRKRLLTPGHYATEIKAPDIEAITANDSGSGAARDHLADAVEHNVIMFNLAGKNTLAKVYEYIELSGPRMTPSINEADYLNGHGVALFRNLFIQFEEQLIGKLAEAPIPIRQGEMLSIVYSIDHEGDLQIQGVGRMTHSFSFDVPALDSDRAKARLLSDIAAVVEDKVVQGYVNSPKHPFFSYWQLKNTLNPTISDEGRKRINALAMDITKYLSGKIIENPDSVQGGRFQVSCSRIDSVGLVEPVVQQVLISQNHVGTTITTPDVSGVSHEQRNEMYEVYACGSAMHILAGVLREEYSNGDVARFAEALAFAKDSYYKDTDGIGSISDAQKKGLLRLSGNEAKHLDSLYNSTVDSVLEAMYNADQDISVPVYVEMRMKDELTEEGAQKIESVRSSHVFLKPGMNSYVDISLPAIEKSRLTREALENNAKEIVNKVAVYVLGSSMEQAGHPLKEVCFEQDGDSVRLSETGAELLGSQISSIADRLGKATLGARAGLSPEHFNGMSIRFFYGVDDSGSFYLRPEVKVDYVRQQEQEDKNEQ